jgi:hypothetical protein
LIKLGHTVKLMPPAYVKAYVKRGKTDAADAEAICEAVARPSMRFVPVKSAEQQSVLMLHRVRALLIRQRTMLVNALRGHLAEFGIVVAQGISRIRELIAILTDESPDAPLSPLARRALAPLVDQLLDLQPRIRGLEAELLRWQGAVGADLQDGGWLSAHAAGSRCHGGDPLRTNEDSGADSLDQQPAVQKTSSVSLGCARQQDGPDRLGSPVQRRGLPFCHAGWRLSAATS